MRTIIRAERHATLDDVEIDRILGLPKTATIAFLAPDGSPRQLPCWFLWRDGAFWTTSEIDKFHVRCLRADPRGSFCVDIDEGDENFRRNRQVKGNGHFEIHQTGAASLLVAMRSKYLGEPAATESVTELVDRIVLRLAPVKLRAHGGDLTFGEANGS